jgi:hypothetical protein
MLKTLSAIAAAAVIAFVIAVIPGFATQVDASTMTVSAKSDRLDLGAIGKDCSKKAWPYFENSCLRVEGAKTMPKQQVRVVSVERR